MMRLTAQLPMWIEQLSAAAILPDDSDEIRIRKATVTLTTATIIVLASVWTVTYWYLGLRLPAMLPLSYQVISLCSLLLFLRSKNVRWFAHTQCLLMLWLPFLLQWSLGGFVGGSGVMLWAFIAPLGALMCIGIRQAVPWYVAFLVLTVVSGLLDPTLSTNPAPISTGARTLLLVLNIAGPTATTFVVLAYSVHRRDQARAALARKHQQLVFEQARSEELLLNVLPRPIAERLKRGEEPIADRMAEATVLFADLVGFTPLAEHLDPDAIVEILNDLFSRFDELAEGLGLEKIKTVGDGYMLAGGLPGNRPDHIAAVAEMALAMRRIVAESPQRHGVQLAIRVGIDTGPVVAGVIGKRKFSYDLWGDTVNTASRMASHGYPGSAQVTEAVFMRLRARYRFSLRSDLDVKGKGSMPVYQLHSRLSSPDGAAASTTSPSPPHHARVTEG